MKIYCTRTVPVSICAAVVTQYARQDRGQPVVEGTRTMLLSTCAAVVTQHARQDRGQPVVEGSLTMPPSTCAALADSSVRVDGIRPVEEVTVGAARYEKGEVKGPLTSVTRQERDIDIYKYR